MALVTVRAEYAALYITQCLSIAEGKGWRDMVLTDACLGPNDGTSLTFGSQAPFVLEIAAITRDEGTAGAACSF